MSEEQERSIYESAEADNHAAVVDEIVGRTVETFDGADAADAQARRFARGEYQQSDLEPAQSDPYDDDNYTGPRHGSEVRDFEGLKSFAYRREALAREKYPDYDEIVNNWVAPRLHEFTQDQIRAFLLQDNFAELAYRTGKKLQQEHRSRAPSQEEIDRLSPEELQARLDELSHSAATRDEDEPKSFLSRREMRRLNNLPPSEFAAALDALRAGGR
jgi:hypothetical protein